MISYDLKKDLQNWLRIKEKYPNDFTITEYYPFDKSIDLVSANADEILNSLSITDLDKFNKQAKQVSVAWLDIEHKVLNEIFVYLGTVIPKIDFTANLTTAYYMLYDEKDNWFMIPTYKILKEQLKIIAHELFHLYQLKMIPSLQIKDRETEVAKFLHKIDGVFQ